MLATAITIGMATFGTTYLIYRDDRFEDPFGILNFVRATCERVIKGVTKCCFCLSFWIAFFYAQLYAITDAFVYGNRQPLLWFTIMMSAYGINTFLWIILEEITTANWEWQTYVSLFIPDREEEEVVYQSDDDTVNIEGPDEDGNVTLEVVAVQMDEFDKLTTGG